MTITNVKTRRTLELVVEKAEKLSNLSFVQAVLTNGLSIEVNFSSDKPTIIESVSPHGEAIDAFVLTFRFFIQNNESISLGSLASLKDDPEISDEWKQRFASIRDAINAYLDMESSLVVGDEKLTYRKIMNVYVYGLFAHANENFYDTGKKWQSLPIMADMIHYRFCEALMNVLNAIQRVGLISQQELLK